MKWLITTDTRVDATLLEKKLERLGAHRDDTPPVPLGDREVVWSVDGPANLDRTLPETKGILEIYPSSSMTLY
ncbi:hypothetical protein [Azospirillum agricola]|uniref:hypothetical protein n=1 Tax=Azospirillum agricola TaxID=1720247 RepID=UPI000A0F230A|nr:hypothetical protein [Azospirillum agricola]MBP2228524.1 hypothetical protein [Azospirillum agricola]SMH33697.1 hypothetical protein SAMN02982994_0708 [Azospirillum lipoferum]